MTRPALVDHAREVCLAHDAARWHVDGALSSMLARCAHALLQRGFELGGQSGPGARRAENGAWNETVQTLRVLDAANGATYELGGVLTTSVTAGLLEHRLQTYARSQDEWMPHLLVYRTYVDVSRGEERDHEAVTALGTWLANEGLEGKLLAELLDASIP